LTTALDAAKEALRSGDKAWIRTASEGLQQAYSAAGASLYQAAPSQEADAAAAPGADAGQAATQEDVVEADYEIVDDTK
jgi:molecular chaperone DnaK